MRTKKMLLVIGCWLLGQQMTYAQSANTNLNAAFTADILSPDELNSFEKRAGQKVSDFYNYVQIVSDPKTEMTLREEAKKQAMELFFLPSRRKIDNTPLPQFLDSCMKITVKSVSPYVTTTTIMNKLDHGTDSSSWGGCVEFTLCYTSAHLLQKKADFMLIKTEKQFGDEKRWVWTVLLGNIVTIRPY